MILASLYLYSTNVDIIGHSIFLAWHRILKRIPGLHGDVAKYTVQLV